MSVIGPSYEQALKAKRIELRNKFFPLPIRKSSTVRRRAVSEVMDSIDKQFRGYYLYSLFKRHDKKKSRSVCAASALDIEREAAREFGVTLAEIEGNGRHRNIVYARHKSAFRMRSELGWSFPRIARNLGMGDHTSAMHAYKKHKKRMVAEQ